MEQIYNQLIEGLHEVFPESEDLTFAPDSILGDLPDWDSMAAVNLQSSATGIGYRNPPGSPGR